MTNNEKNIKIYIRENKFCTIKSVYMYVSTIFVFVLAVLSPRNWLQLTHTFFTLPLSFTSSWCSLRSLSKLNIPLIVAKVYIKWEHYWKFSQMAGYIIGLMSLDTLNLLYNNSTTNIVSKQFFEIMHWYVLCSITSWMSCWCSLYFRGV